MGSFKGTWLFVTYLLKSEYTHSSALFTIPIFNVCKVSVTISTNRLGYRRTIFCCTNRCFTHAKMKKWKVKIVNYSESFVLIAFLYLITDEQNWSCSCSLGFGLTKTQDQDQDQDLLSKTKAKTETIETCFARTRPRLIPR